MLTVVIQAGGESRRMGQDKALLPFQGQPLIQRVYERVAPLADAVLVTTNRPDDFAFLGVSLLPDIERGRGALGGLYTALKSANTPLVAVVACDMPFVNPELLAAECHLLENSRYAAAIPRTEDGIEPFHAAYQREACLPAIEAALDARRWRVDAWFEDVDIRYLEELEIRRYDPSGTAFFNVNTPEDLRRAYELAENEPAGRQKPNN